MDTNDVVGEILETGGAVAKKSGKAVVNAVSDVAGSAANQVVPGIAKDQNEKNISKQNQQSVPQNDQSLAQDILKEFYGKSNTPQQQAQSQNPNYNPNPNPNPNMTPKDQQKAKEEVQIERLRQELHAEYYQKLTNPPKPQEERPAEKIEREKMQDLQELQKKEAEKPDYALQKAQRAIEIKGEGVG